MNHQVQAYIDRINANYPKLTEIILENLGLTDAEVAPLMLALASNSSVAGQIKTLNLNSNELNTVNLPNTIRALKVLSLNNNQLTSINIPGTLTELESLYITDNQLTSIDLPDTLIALLELWVQNNRLSILNIPSSFRSLKSLHVEYNRLILINIPNTLNLLSWISLYDNQLTSINIPDTLTELQRLYINNNQLTSIDLPVTLIALKVLRVEHNRLSNLNIPSSFRSLQSLSVSHNRLILINIPNTLNLLEEILINDNQLISVTMPSSLPSIQTLLLDNNQFSIMTKIMLNQCILNNPIRHLFVDFDIHGFSPDLITNHALSVHFKSLLEHIQDVHNKFQPMRNMLVRGTCLPNDLIRMVFEFLNEIQVAQYIVSPNYMKFELNTFKNLFPGQEDIINRFEATDEFKNMNASYGKSLPQLENEARANDRGMKALLNSYQRKIYTPNFEYLRDYSPIDPASNPYQVTVWRPKAQ